MDNRKIILASYVVLGLIVWFLSHSMVAYAFQQFYQVRRFLAGSQIAVVGVKEGIPLILGAAVFLYFFTNVRVNSFMDEVVAELRKVTWPNRQDVVRSTIVVLGCIVVASVVLGLYDSVWGQVISFFLKG